jgi:hypothetical protein
LQELPPPALPADGFIPPSVLSIFD